MWVKLDDQLGDHPKILAAGELLGKNGPALALSVYVLGLLWTNKHLTNGELSLAAVRHFRHVGQPLVVADALVHAGLWERRTGGFYVHDYAEWNPVASDVKARRREERLRKRRYRAEHRARAGAT